MCKLYHLLGFIMTGLLVLARTGSARAAHESSNHLTVQPAAEANASGRGIVNYVKGRARARTAWVARFRFADLMPGGTSTVTAFGPGVARSPSRAAALLPRTRRVQQQRCCTTTP